MGSLAILPRHAAEAVDIAWPDVYFSPGYARVVEHSDRAPWYVAIWEPGPIVMPYLLRTVPTGDELGRATPAYDVTSPYGYSGCWAPADVPGDQWQAFRRALQAELKVQGAVTEFLRLGSLVDGRTSLLEADKTLTATRHNDTIAIATSQGPDAYWEGCEGRARTAVRKAQRLGYTAESRAVKRGDLMPGSVFRQMYASTMQRVAAQPYYFFDDEYFTTLHDSLANHLQWFIVYHPDGKPAVMALTIVWPPLLHLHLVGSDPQSMRDGAGNLCYDAMLRWACEHPGIEQCHLGGGLTADDPLFRFKKSFGGRRLPYWVASSILDAERYQHLVRARAAELGCDASILQSCDYFPAYRASEQRVHESSKRAAA